MWAGEGCREGGGGIWNVQGEKGFAKETRWEREVNRDSGICSAREGAEQRGHTSCRSYFHPLMPLKRCFSRIQKQIKILLLLEKNYGALGVACSFSEANSSLAAKCILNFYFFLLKNFKPREVDLLWSRTVPMPVERPTIWTCPIVNAGCFGGIWESFRMQSLDGFSSWTLTSWVISSSPKAYIPVNCLWLPKVLFSAQTSFPNSRLSLTAQQPSSAAAFHTLAEGIAPGQALTSQTCSLTTNPTLTPPQVRAHLWRPRLKPFLPPEILSSNRISC